MSFREEIIFGFTCSVHRTATSLKRVQVIFWGDQDLSARFRQVAKL